MLANLPRLGLPLLWGSAGEYEVWYLRAYFVFAAIVYGRWAVLVVGSICRYLDINALTITPRLVPKKDKGKESGEVANGSVDVDAAADGSAVVQEKNLRNWKVAAVKN